MTRLVAVLAITCATACGGRDPAAPRVLRVCADPNNLPFSNARGEGFENRIAELVARELGAELAYEWKPQRRGFLRTGVNAGACDVVLGLAAGVEMAATTQPYYESSYVAVRRAADGDVGPLSLDDPTLAGLRLGVQVIGDDYTNSPPAHALARRGLARNLRGYTVYGDYAEDSPPADVVRAVALGEVDVAFAWGPIAGYHARRSAVPLQIVPLASGDPTDPPMRFAIAMAVRKDDDALRAELDHVIATRRDEITAILAAYGVPGA